MNVNTINEVDRENIVWLIYLFIIGAAFISNYFVERYLYTMDEEYKKIFRNINILILSISLIIYVYFCYESYKSVKKEPNKIYLWFVLFASILVLIGGIIYLAVELYKGANPEISII